MAGLSRSIRLAERDASIVSSVELLANYGVSAVRKTRRGELKQLKHVSFGWISAGTFATIQGIKRNVGPLLTKFVEGGYRLKQAIWSVSVSIEGVSLPILGAVMVVTAITAYWADIAAGNPLGAYFDLACLILPFGEVYLIYRLILGIEAILKDAYGFLGSPSGFAWSTLLSGALPGVSEISGILNYLNAYAKSKGVKTGL